MVKDKVIDIRKVDKGQLILIIDYEQRILTEQSNISKIASLSEFQVSDWKETQEFTQGKMKQLYHDKFVSKNELASVTGLLAGGAKGNLKNTDGSMKFTNIISQKECFAKQTTPYVYPLFKAHKLSKEELVNIKPDEVHNKLPSRLVVGMGYCQFSRVQAWLEHFLTPLSIMYGNFEYIKDSSSFLYKLENIKSIAREENWDLDKMTIFTVDVKSLYPSVKFEFLKEALIHCMNKCTQWNDTIKNTLLELIMYTLKHQQVLWNKQYYTLNKGIPTGGKDSVPLANILLSFIMLCGIDVDSDLMTLIKLWARFIDDCCGLFNGDIHQFLDWFRKLENVFLKYGLELTCDTDSFEIRGGETFEKEEKIIAFLDIDIFKYNGEIHTKEHRKETSVNSYLPIYSAHPRHTFAGIIKSQLYRLRRICSRDSDFHDAIVSLKKRCLNSGYSEKLVNEILNHGNSLVRTLETQPKEKIVDNKEEVRLIILAGTSYEKNFVDFAKRINGMAQLKLKINLVKCTGPTLGQMLFNNTNRSTLVSCDVKKCVVCPSGIQNKTGKLTSNVTGITYSVSKELCCNDGGIYVVSGKCSGQYTGKTVGFGVRSIEHFKNDKKSSIYSHMRECEECKTIKDFTITMVESYLTRGKYTMSEREYLWNWRIKSYLNINKTLKA